MQINAVKLTKFIPDTCIFMAFSNPKLVYGRWRSLCGPATKAKLGADFSAATDPLADASSLPPPQAVFCLDLGSFEPQFAPPNSSFWLRQYVKFIQRASSLPTHIHT